MSAASGGDPVGGGGGGGGAAAGAVLLGGFLSEIARSHDTNWLLAVKYSDLGEIAATRLAALTAGTAGASSTGGASRAASSNDDDAMTAFRALVQATNDADFLRAVAATDFTAVASAARAALSSSSASSAATTTKTWSKTAGVAGTGTGISRAERVLAAVLGGFVADAAAMPSHWVCVCVLGDPCHHYHHHRRRRRRRRRRCHLRLYHKCRRRLHHRRRRHRRRRRHH